MPKTKVKTQFIPCTPVELPKSSIVQSALEAVRVNPCNAPAITGIIPSILTALHVHTLPVIEPMKIAVLTSKYWGAQGIDLTVGFMEQTPNDLRDRILSHMNAVGGTAPRFANIKFRWSPTTPDVRITRSGDGYWSYLGVDVRSIPRSRPTMCLQGFTMSTPEREYRRVVRHETLHTCGCPHEHLRRQLVDRIDPAKAITYFRQMGWDEATTRSNVLTPLEERSIMGTPHAEETSIMAYQLPASITRDGRPIQGGSDLTPLDKEFLGKIYPVTDVPPHHLPPTASKVRFVIETDGKVTGARLLTLDPPRGLGDLSIVDLVETGKLLLKLLELLGIKLGGSGGTDPAPTTKSRITLEADVHPGAVRVVSV